MLALSNIIRTLPPVADELGGDFVFISVHSYHSNKFIYTGNYFIDNTQ